LAAGPEWIACNTAWHACNQLPKPFSVDWGFVNELAYGERYVRNPPSIHRHLGFNYYFINTTANTGSLPVWASYAQCSGNEDKFFKCQMWGLRDVADCASAARGVVACANTPTIAAPPPPASSYACE
jgi:hypothetical protein